MSKGMIRSDQIWVGVFFLEKQYCVEFAEKGVKRVYSCNTNT